MSGGNARGLSQAQPETENSRRTEINDELNLGQPAPPHEPIDKSVKEFQKRLEAGVNTLNIPSDRGVVNMNFKPSLVSFE